MKLLTLEQAAHAPSAEVGGKARGLARLAALGLPVPRTLVLPSGAYQRWLSEGLAREAVKGLWSQAAALAPLAVRSSAADEDSADRSAAGQYESVMSVCDADGLAVAIDKCFDSAQDVRASSYRHGTAAVELALVLQSEIAADRSGVAFSADPVTGSRAVVLIEAVFGHGEGIVSGELEPDRFTVDRESGLVRARIATKPSLLDGRGGRAAVAVERRTSRTLRDHEARAIAELVVRAEAGFTVPVDVEFCLQGERLWLLQCRPITTLDGPR